jgi:site-specific DNA-cytosine methylase
MKQMIDLFSGLGGASEGFLVDGWSVNRYENNPLLGDVPFTTLCDLHTYKIKLPGEAFLVWASPPCDEFSRGFNAPGPTAQREGREFEPSLELLKRSMTIIEELNPTYWCIENVVGAIKHFEPLLGEPRQIIGPFVLWGNFPLIDVDRFNTHTKAGVDVWSTDPLRKNKKGKIPLELSSSFRRVLDSQKQLAEF